MMSGNDATPPGGAPRLPAPRLHQHPAVGKELRRTTAGNRRCGARATPAQHLEVTVDTCPGPRAYAGLSSTYAERITENFERLTDEAWEPLAMKGVPDVPWLAPVLTH